MEVLISLPVRPRWKQTWEPCCALPSSTEAAEGLTTGKICNGCRMPLTILFGQKLKIFLKSVKIWVGLSVVNIRRCSINMQQSVLTFTMLVMLLDDPGVAFYGNFFSVFVKQHVKVCRWLVACGISREAVPVKGHAEKVKGTSRETPRNRRHVR